MTVVPTTPAVTFAQADFVALFPEFTNCSAAQEQGWFNRAGLICANVTNSGPYRDGCLATLLYLLTAHIGWLNAPRDAQGNPAATGTPAPPLVGRVNSAGEGSVNVGVDMGDANVGSPNQAWFMQTRYGAEYWAATAPYRTMRYARAPFRQFQPVFPWRGGRW